MSDLVAYFLFIPFIIYLFRKFYLEKLQLSQLSKRPVFITGCDSGFGKALVLKLLENGIPTFAGCLTQNGKSELENEAKKLPGLLETLIVDVKSEESLCEAKKLIERELNDMDLWAVVCNAGIGNFSGPEDFLTCQDYQSTCDVNTFGAIRTVQIFRPLIKQSGGRFVVMVSMMARLPIIYQGPYAVSKYALKGYVDVLRIEARNVGYSIHTLEPGFFHTSLTRINVFRENCLKIYNRAPDNVKGEYGEDFMETLINASEKSLNKWASGDLTPVIDSYYHALTSRFPRSNYITGIDAQFISLPLSIMPRWLSDPIIDFLNWLENTPFPPKCGAKKRTPNRDDTSIKEN